MSTFDIVRAWKDAEYRQSLSAEEQARLPGHPAGAIELADEDLSQAAGGDIRLTFETCRGASICTIDFICPVQPLTA